MSLIELIVIAAVIGLLLALASGLYDHAIDRARTRHATVLIATLDRATRAYFDACGAWPPGSIDGSLRRPLPALLAVPESKSVLADLSPSLLYVVDGQARCRDPWGGHVRCLTNRVRGAGDRLRVIQNGGVPVFESAGPDQAFGTGSAPRQADNICSDEPMDLAEK